MELSQRIEQLISPSLAAMGYELVRVRLEGSGRGRTLQIMAERADREEMTVEDCAAISRDISAIIDVEDPIPGAFTLEVSSPGVDRPLVRLGDYDRFSGLEAKLETREPIDGRRRFQGRLAGCEGDRVRIECAGEEAVVPFDCISKAKLVLTDELIAAMMNKQNG